MSVRLTISGDFCITPSYLSKNLLSEKISQQFSEFDINIVNLECPINNGDDKNKILKNGPHLQTTNEIFKYLKQLNITAVTLANNHILDYGVEGLQNTIDGCRKNRISFTGVGNNLKEAATPTIINQNGIKIALVNFCENEWSIATDNTGGANPLDIIENFSQIKKARNEADFVLVIVHGGNEYYNMPSPRMVKQYRFFAQNGADAVISHHTHCISGMEVHKNVPIFYGLGNMLFTKESKEPGWYTGLTLLLILSKGQNIKWKLIPTAQRKNTYELYLPESTEKENLIKEVEDISAIVSDEKKLRASWSTLIEKRKAQYLYLFSAMNLVPGKYLRGILKHLGFIKILFPKKYLLSVINYIYCEAHLDLSKEILSKKLLEK